MDEQDHTVTLDVPHASPPTVRTWVHLYRISEGPKRTVSRLGLGAPHSVLYVPSGHTWTLDTVRLLMHGVAAFIPGGDPQGNAVAFVYVNPRGFVCIDAETARGGAGIAVTASALTTPMRVAIAALRPTAGVGTVGLPLAAIAGPGTGRLATSGRRHDAGDRTDRGEMPPANDRRGATS